MKPTYKPNEEVYVNRLAYLFRKPKIGDVIIIKGIPRHIRQAPRQEAGRHDKQVPRQRAGRQDKLIIKRIDHFSKQGYFLLGDNKNKSTDSRHFGVIKKQDIVGKILG